MKPKPNLHNKRTEEQHRYSGVGIEETQTSRRAWEYYVHSIERIARLGRDSHSGICVFPRFAGTSSDIKVTGTSHRFRSAYAVFLA